MGEVTGGLGGADCAGDTSALALIEANVDDEAIVDADSGALLGLGKARWKASAPSTFGAGSSFSPLENAPRSSALRVFGAAPYNINADMPEMATTKARYRTHRASISSMAAARLSAAPTDAIAEPDSRD